MYMFVNHFTFEYPKKDISDTDILEAINQLGNLFIELKELNVDLIIHSKLSQAILNKKHIREYITILKDRNVQDAFNQLLNKTRPICSDLDTPYERDEAILNNCVEEKEKIDILETFLACAMYYNNPILTINNICSKSQFLEDTIKITCDDNQFELNNYKLIPYRNVIEQIKEYQKIKLLDQHNAIVNWNDYQIFVNKNFDYCKITDHCLECLSKKFSYSNSYSIQLRNKIQRMNTLIQQNNGQISTIDFKSLGLGTPESDTRFKELKESHKGIKDYNNNSINLNWHDYIQKDFRIYFEKDTEYVSFVHFEKKIG